MARNNKNNDAGFALVVVILVLLLASFLASQLTMQTREELQVAHNIKMRTTGHFLAEAVDSALSQTHPNMEILVLDDASSDAICIAASINGRAVFGS